MGKPQQVLHSALALGPQHTLWEQVKASVPRRGVSPTAIPLCVCPLQMCCSGASPSAASPESFHPSAANGALSLFCSHRSGGEDDIPHRGRHQPSASTILSISIPSMPTSCPFTAQQCGFGHSSPQCLHEDSFSFSPPPTATQPDHQLLSQDSQLPAAACPRPGQGT